MNIRSSLICAALITVSFSPACEGPREPIPEELLGTWTTDNERYADRALQFTKYAVVFHTGPGEFELAGFGVDDFRVTEREDGHRDYDIGYAEGTGITRLEFVYEPSAKTIQLPNQPLTFWTRQSATDSAAVEAAPGVGP
jgi:hypothetical protein